MSGNGADLGHIVAMLGTVIEAQHRTETELRDLRAEFRRDMSSMKKDMASLRQAVTEYHSSVLGHGILISDLEERVRRIEEHLRLPPEA